MNKNNTENSQILKTIKINTTLIDKLVEENIKLRKRMWDGANGLCSSDYPEVSRKRTQEKSENAVNERESDPTTPSP
ncbi:MAG: hypothetical protein QF855_01045 [Candidatus Pacebacteria bacterium]|nr:hypothetical protein [Candidatus Paceibacterota bacterium]